MADHRIFVRQRAGELPFTVNVEPAPDGRELGGLFADHRAAFGFAVGLRMTHGWPVVDLASDHALGDLVGGTI